MKIITVIGARPQFIKAAVVSHVIRQMAQRGVDIQEALLHTGQHYDYNMSALFFSQLGLAEPQWHLDCGNDIKKMKAAIKPILQAERPDVVLVYGDTNSTLAGAESARELVIPVAHIEAGLRSFNDTMPEERNRILTDRIAQWRFCPTVTAMQNLQQEGLGEHSYLTGDVMYDATLLFRPAEKEQRSVLAQYGVSSKQFVLATIHRASTAENVPALHSILQALRQIPMPVLLPLHPHTAKTVNAHPSLQQVLRQASNIHVIEPVGYLQMLTLERHAHRIITDSGGIQKEAYFQQTPCITLRNETEWTETVEAGWNHLAGTETEHILQAFAQAFAQRPIDEYGDGHSAQQILRILCPNAF